MFLQVLTRHIPVLSSTIPSYAHFTSSAPLWALPNHRLFTQVDWEQVEAGMYAVVDPIAVGRILYLSEQDYIIMVRVSLTNNRTLKVLAAPGDSPDSSTTSSSSSSPQNTPPHPFVEALLKKCPSKRKAARVRRLFHSPFLEWRSRTNGDWDSMIECTKGNFSTLITRWYNIVSWWSRGKTISTVAAAERNSFSAKCLSLYQNNGIQYTINYFKGSLFIVNSFLAGKRITAKDSPAKVRIRITNGLPAFLPCYARNGIRGSEMHTIHIWTSVLNMYKAFKGTWELSKENLGTITQPHPNLYGNPNFHMLRVFVDLFWAEIQSLGGNLKPDLKVKNLFCSSKAGPHHPNVVLGAPLDAYIWFHPDEHTGIASNYIKDWFEETGDRRMWELFRRTAKTYALVTSVLRSVAATIKPSPGQTFSTSFNLTASLVGGLDRLRGKRSYDEGFSFVHYLGRLHALYEPAGKVRIVAIVDWWTHAALKPLHDWMFSILKLLETDATFDQEGALRRFSKMGHTEVWSIDLSSATDLIPLLLYRVLLEPILGTRLADLWLRLLSGRNFVVPSELKEARGVTRHPVDYVRYATGQPMGALSSWSAMALVHHFLVQASAWKVREGFLSAEHACFAMREPILFGSLRASFKWFLDYLILGDDLVIASEVIAREYISLATSLGIKVSLQKSYVSDIGFFNFANQSYRGQTNVSPLSLKEFVGVDSLASRSEMAMRAVRRGWTDITSTRWVAPLVKLFVDHLTWAEIQKDLNQGKTHPIVSWILSVLLVPGSARFAESVLPRASIKVYLATMLRKALIWNKPLESIHSLVNEKTNWNEIVVILTRVVDSVYRDFLETRKRLAAYHGWADLNLSIEGSTLFELIIHDQAKARLAEWETMYRFQLKTVQVLLKLKDIQPHTFELGSGMNLEEVSILLSRASEDLPHLPDFSKLDFQDLERETSQGRWQGEIKTFSRLLATVGAYEHLHSHATPGIDYHSSSAPKEPNPKQESPSL